MTETGANKRDGFTLLEVMIAISILAIALTTLLGNQSQSLSVAAESRFVFISSLLVKQKLAEFQLSDEILYDSEGDFGEDYPGYFWKIKVESPDFSELPALIGADQFLNRIELSVYLEDERNSLTISRFILTDQP